MKDTGRPLRFLVLLVGGWICVRAVMLTTPVFWPGREDENQPSRPTLSKEKLVTSSVMAGARSNGEVESDAQAEAAFPTRPGIVGLQSANMARLASNAHTLIGAAPVPLSLQAGVERQSEVELVDTTRARDAPGSEPLNSVKPVGRSGRGARGWSGTAWVLWRPDAGSGAVLLPLLGGSQAGARIDYRLANGPGGQLSVYGRASRALAGPSAEEGALGIAWRPGALPFSLLVERRERLGPGGRSGFALVAAGGLNPREIAPHVEGEGYIQAGIVGSPGADAFVDGKASIAYRLMSVPARATLTFGASLGASVQPGARRVDLGPELRLRVPTDHGGLRLSAEWRARIAGNARPASGPALTLIADF